MPCGATAKRLKRPRRCAMAALRSFLVEFQFTNGFLSIAPKRLLYATDVTLGRPAPDAQHAWAFLHSVRFFHKSRCARRCIIGRHPDHPSSPQVEPSARSTGKAGPAHSRRWGTGGTHRGVCAHWRIDFPPAAAGRLGLSTRGPAVVGP
jgi:hypothetical protein